MTLLNLRTALVLSLLWITGCTGVPAGVEPVTNFDLERYLGTWHEIARLDHSFERGLSAVTAEYALNPDGSVSVLNSGTNGDSGEREIAEGRAKFVDASNTGHLKVSFFGPFYGSYVVFELDEDYRYSFVSGPTTDYLWLLARDPVVGADVRARFKDRAKALGFDVDQLIWAMSEAD